MIKTNTEIAKLVQLKGYDFERALEMLDEMRTPEQEGEELTESQIEDLVMEIGLSIRIEIEEEEENRRFGDYVVVWTDDTEEERNFHISAMTETDASDACYCENADEVTGYRQLRIFQA